MKAPNERTEIIRDRSANCQFALLPRLTHPKTSAIQGAKQALPPVTSYSGFQMNVQQTFQFADVPGKGFLQSHQQTGKFVVPLTHSENAVVKKATQTNSLRYSYVSLLICTENQFIQTKITMNQTTQYR